MDGFAIKDLEFHSMSNKVVSMSSRITKIWDKTTVGLFYYHELQYDFFSQNKFGKLRKVFVIIIFFYFKGKPHTSIESDVEYNDLCVVPNTGMMFMATEDKKMQTYFLPV